MRRYINVAAAVDSVSFRFGGLGGVITMSLTDREDSKSDRMALGFIVAPSPQLHQHHHQQHLPLNAQLQQPATILRLSSTTSNDFIQCEMSEGVVSVVYNMGKVAHRVSESSLRVDDGQYHVVRFIRSGPNSSLQLDNLPPQRKHPTGKQLTMFNQQGLVSIGASKDPSGRVVRPFHGIIAGVMLNGLWLLELVAEGDTRATVEGDIDLNVTPLKSNQLSLHPVPSFTIRSPDVVLITSKMITVRANYQRRPEKPGLREGNVSSSFSSFGCLNVDDEECSMLASPSRDKRIGSDVTKSAGQSTSRPSFLTTDPTSRSLRHACRHDDDDDDCASGDDDLTSDREGQSPIRANDKFIRVQEQRTSTYSSAIQLGPSKNSSSLIQSSTSSTFFRRGGGGSSTHPGKGRPSLPLPTRTVPQTRPPSSSSDSLRTSRATPTNQSKALVGANSRSTGSGGSAFGRNVALIAGIASGTVVLVLVLCYVVYRYRGQEEGSYKLDTVDSYDPGAMKPSLCSIGGGEAASSGRARTARHIREWYV